MLKPLIVDGISGTLTIVTLCDAVRVTPPEV